MSKLNTIKKQTDKSAYTSFFYEDWLMRELQDSRRKAFIPQSRMEEGPKEYRLSFRVQNLCREHCSIVVDFPYLYIRIQQSGSGLLALLSLRPAVHIFARHFFIPFNVDTEKISFAYKGDRLTIRLPKYYAEVE